MMRGIFLVRRSDAPPSISRLPACFTHGGSVSTLSRDRQGAGGSCRSACEHFGKAGNRYFKPFPKNSKTFGAASIDDSAFPSGVPP